MGFLKSRIVIWAIMIAGALVMTASPILGVLILVVGVVAWGFDVYNTAVSARSARSRSDGEG
jgi:hypothetical protein